MDQKKIEQIRAHLKRDADVGNKGLLDSEAIRYEKEGKEDKLYEDIRPPFFRDVDRIVHSKAYARYIDKTQVFFDINSC